jgi:hypothetical protein
MLSSFLFPNVMRKILAGLFGILFLGSCSNTSYTIDPNGQLSKEEQAQFKYEIVRYFEKLPSEKVHHEDKFDTLYNSYYQQKAKEANLLFYYKAPDSSEYFAIAKIAPSLTIKRVATIGKLKKDKEGKITYYEEAARTWKMVEPELHKKTEVLFMDFIQGEDLSPYYTKNSGEDFYIEFPDDRTFYNTQTRKWETNPIQ